MKNIFILFLSFLIVSDVYSSAKFYRIICEKYFNGKIVRVDLDNYCQIKKHDLVKNFNKLTGSLIKDPLFICEGILRGDVYNAHR